eukprot:CAMPEP_0117750724 /NCGR_PEP_ID=MMETSP0947-20121206/10545_1 /TAXON_ID=44440 /ORGANISM="Chattonella subsalsa, Strain CCMP2191" /LENGTH=808 /DNA_ID=CAMNT_0005568959 /DNA_START=242 /DNA_END=2668 /DNA_ORIENTATION=-
MWKWFHIYLCFCLTILLVAESAAGGYSLTVGSVFPNPLLSNDLGVWQGLELWRTYVLETGGIELDNGEIINEINFKNMSVDTTQEYQGNETAVYEAAYEVCSDGNVSAIVCPVPYTPDCVRACAPLGKVQFAMWGATSMCSADVDDYGNDGTYTFCIPVESTAYSHGIMSTAKTLGYEKAGIMWYSGHPGIASVGPVMGPNAEELFDLNVVLNTGYDFPVTLDDEGNIVNYTASVVSTLEEARDLGVQSLIVRSYTETPYLLQIMEDIGYTPEIFWATVSPSKPTWMEDSFGLGERVTAGVQWHETAPASCPIFGSAAQFGDLYRLRFGDSLSYFVAMGALAGVSLHLAVQSESATDPDSIKEGLENINTEVFFGLLRYNRYGRNIGRDPLTLQWINGIQEVVFPVETSTASFVHPLIPWECRDEICLEVLAEEEGATSAFRFIAVVELTVAVLGMLSLAWLRKKPIFKFTSPLFCELMLFFGCLAFIAVILFTMNPKEGHSGNILCTARVWMLGLAATGVLSNLFAKTFRLAKIAGNQTMHRMRIGNTQLLLFVVGFLSVEAAILTVWTMIDPPQYNEIVAMETEYSGVAYPTCSFNSMFFFINLAYFVVMNIWGATLSWKVRNIPSAYNESKYINFSLYAILFILALLIPIQYATDAGAETSLIITSLGVLVVITTVLATVIGSKFLTFCFPKTDQFQMLESAPSLANLENMTTNQDIGGITTQGISGMKSTDQPVTSGLGVSGISMHSNNKTAPKSKILPVNDQEHKFDYIEKGEALNNERDAPSNDANTHNGERKDENTHHNFI